MQGSLNKTFETGYEVEVHWNIKDFLSNFETIPNSIESPSFIWQDTTWQLSLKCDSDDIVKFYLNKLKSEKEVVSVIFKSGFLLVNENTEMRCCLTKIFTENNGFGTLEFIYKSELLERKHEILPDESLTIYCSVDHLANLKNHKRLKKESLDILSSNFKALYGCTKRSDLTITVGEKRYPVHKIILEARSDVFAAMFRHDMDESNSGIINISDCDPVSFNDFLLFLYTGKIKNISSSNACHLFKIADKYHVQDLKSTCIQFMKNNMSTDNLFEIATLANQFEETELISLTQEFFKRNALKIVKGDNWEQFLKQNFPIANELLISVLGKLEN